MWKKVPSIDKYLVNENGEVFSLRSAKKLTLQRKHGGYIYVALTIDGKLKLVPVHRMVCEAFNGPGPVEGYQVDHINGDRADNRPCNLEWVSPSTNVRRGKSKPVRAISPSGETITFSHLAMVKACGFNVNAISHALHRYNPANSQGYRWEYVTE